MISEVDREIRMRKEVYAGQVGRGKMRQAEADYKIAMMEEVKKTLLWLEMVDRDELKAYLAVRKAKQTGKADGVQGGEASGEGGAG
jgi:hypothetical protein